MNGRLGRRRRSGTRLRRRRGRCARFQLGKELGTKHGTIQRVADQIGCGVESLQTWVKQADICDQYWTVVNQLEIFYNSAADPPGSGFGADFEVNMIKTIRHELGHSAGLSHSSTAPDAMRSGWVNTNLGWTTYSQHHIDHVNAAN